MRNTSLHAPHVPAVDLAAGGVEVGVFAAYSRRVPFKSAIKVLRRLLAIVHVVLGKTVVEEDVNRIVDRQALQEFVVFAQIKIAVQRSAIYLDQGVVLARFFALRHGFLQHPPEPVSVPQFPVGLRAIGTILQNGSEQGHRLLDPAGGAFCELGNVYCHEY